jgi:hypothetical protein
VVDVAVAVGDFDGLAVHDIGIELFVVVETAAMAVPSRGRVPASGVREPAVAVRGRGCGAA